MSPTETIVSQFAQDVKAGLSKSAKFLSSRYFYDKVGDALFQDIMRLPEYYLTDCEYEIFTSGANKILEAIAINGAFELVELGAGDGLKTKVLIKHFLTKNEIEYFPVDISANVLSQLESSLCLEFPQLKVTTLNYEYFHALEKLNKLDDRPKVILFLGSNIGNFSFAGATQFLKKLHSNMNSGDQLICGIDLKKDPATILSAYNDSQGVTKAFNLNLLTRINKEFGGNFDIGQFEHYPVYDPQTGECRSYVISKVFQEVHLTKLDLSIELDAFEPIHMETSRKYSLKEIETMAHEVGFRVKKHFMDERSFFTDTLFIKD